MKSIIHAGLFVLFSVASTGCSNNSENAELPAPEITVEDYGQRAADEEAERLRILQQNEE